MAFNFLNKDGLTYFWNKIKARIGTATLTTTAQDLSGAVNELKSDLIIIRTSNQISQAIAANERTTINYTFPDSVPSGYTELCRSFKRTDDGGFSIMVEAPMGRYYLVVQSTGSAPTLKGNVIVVYKKD